MSCHSALSACCRGKRLHRPPEALRVALLVGLFLAGLVVLGSSAACSNGG
jgi:hypothetical protein